MRLQHLLSGWFKDWQSAVRNGWNQFWFTPRPVGVLVYMRLLFGGLLLYSHLVLAIDLDSFVGDEAWVNQEVARSLHDGEFGLNSGGWSYLWHLRSPNAIWMHHLLTLVITAGFTCGFLTRFTAPLSWFLQVMYVHRLTGALFGFDQIVTYGVMYLMISPCGNQLSVDSWLRRKFRKRIEASRFLSWLFPSDDLSVSATMTTRMFQCHLCVIYLFGGLSKARGITWWDGTATWYAISNYEYQSMDLTWLSNYPVFLSVLTTVTLVWELSYCALVWPRLSRPVVLFLAVLVHSGIALFLGMATFGIAMIAANACFLETRGSKDFATIHSD